MVLDKLGVVNDGPECSDDPPVRAAYQLTVPALGAAPIVTLPGPHLGVGAVPMIVGIVLTVAVTAVRKPVVQPLAVAST